MLHSAPFVISSFSDGQGTFLSSSGPVHGEFAEGLVERDGSLVSGPLSEADRRSGRSCFLEQTDVVL